MFYSHKQEKWIISLDRLQTSPSFLFGPRTVTFSVSPCQSGLLHSNYSLLFPVLSSWPASSWRQKPKPVLQLTSPNAELSKQDYFMPAGCTPICALLDIAQHHGHTSSISLSTTMLLTCGQQPSDLPQAPDPFLRDCHPPFWTCPADTPVSVDEFSFASLAL